MSNENKGPVNNMTKNKWVFEPDQLLLYTAGRFDFIALNQPDAVDKKGRASGKAPLITGWRRAPALSTAQAIELMIEEGHNIGIRLRDTDLVIDVDPRNFEETDDPLRRLQEDLGLDLLAAPTVITGSGGLHIYMSKPADVGIRDSLEAYPGIEFKSVGRQVVSAGSVHPSTKRPYHLDELSGSLSKIPLAPHGLLEVIKRPGRMGNAESGKYRPEQVEEALTFLDAKKDFSKGNYERWLQLAMSCHHATGGEGRSEFLAWCASDPEYSDRAAEVGRKWDGFSSEGSRVISYKYLFGLLGKFGGKEGQDFVRRIDRVPAEDDFPDYFSSATDKYDLDEILATLPESVAGANEALEWFNRAGFCAVTA